MRIFKDIEHLPTFRNAVVAVGSFDGVHLGHKRIFKYVKDGAERLQGESVVVTFDPHPQEVLHPERAFCRINSMEENARLIEEEGIDNLIVIPFTRTFANLSFTGFLEFLVEKIGIRAFVMGPDHNFGRNREGNCKTIEKICANYGIEIILIPEFTMEENTVRSSKIREHIINQEFEKAESLLGHTLKKK